MIVMKKHAVQASTPSHISHDQHGKQAASLQPMQTCKESARFPLQMVLIPREHPVMNLQINVLNDQLDTLLNQQFFSGRKSGAQHGKSVKAYAGRDHDCALCVYKLRKSKSGKRMRWH